jgi:hypothetical protein
MDQERKQLEEDKKKLNDTIPSNDASKSIDDLKKADASAKVANYSPLSFTALFN